MDLFIYYSIIIFIKFYYIVLMILIYHILLRYYDFLFRVMIKISFRLLSYVDFKKVIKENHCLAYNCLGLVFLWFRDGLIYLDLLYFLKVSILL